MPSSRLTVALLLLCSTALEPLLGQESEPVFNWSAPLFFTFPKPEKAEASDPAEPLSVEGDSGPPLLPLVTIPPCRIADTRGNGFSGQAGPPALNTGPRVFQIAGTVTGIPAPCGIPTTAKAVSFQFTIVTPNSAGNLIAWPGGPAPTVSVLNWSAGETALGNGTVVPLSATGSLSVQINAATGGATGHLVLDVNGYYGPDLDSQYVNENQFSSVSGTMITDGSILNVDLSPVAQIADTKLATIATAGKVADTALSSNVTKLGQSIEANEITDVTRELNIPLTSFVRCDGGAGGLLDFSSSATDRHPDFRLFAVNDLSIEFDTDAGFEDEDFEICAVFAIPLDYVSGGSFMVRFEKGTNNTAADENLVCVAGLVGATEATASVAFPGNLNRTACPPPFGVLSAGGTLSFSLSVTSETTMNDIIRIYSVAFRYTASQ